MTDITSLPITKLRSALDKKEFSSLELTNAYLARIEKAQNLNAFITVCPDEARTMATEADKRISKGERASLLGIPIAIKDVILTKDIKSTCASKILHNFNPPYDATVISKLKEKGIVIPGKTNMDEFAMGSSTENSHFGPVRNPWNLECVPGGSSGGSAAAVAARLSPASLGTDTGGSIRQPASLCNIVGVKPTYGRVSRYGVIAFASSLDQVGAFANSVEDCALVTEAISGHDPLDSTSVDTKTSDITSQIGKDIRGVKLGVPKEYFIEGLSAEVKSTISAAIEKLTGLGAEIVEISLPHTSAAVAVYYIIAPAEASSNLARYDGIRYGYRAEKPKGLQDLYCRSRSEGFGDEVKRRIMIGTYVLSSGYFDAYYLRAQKVRTLIKKDFSDAFEKHCDAIICPTSPTTAFKIGDKASDPLAMYLSDVFTIPVNLAGLPGMSLPCGFDSSGLPVGLQIIGKPWDEALLFRVGHAYEQATEWHKRAPKG